MQIPDIHRLKKHVMQCIVVSHSMIFCQAITQICMMLCPNLSQKAAFHHMQEHVHILHMLKQLQSRRFAILWSYWLHWFYMLPWKALAYCNSESNQLPLHMHYYCIGSRHRDRECNIGTIHSKMSLQLQLCSMEQTTQLLYSDHAVHSLLDGAHTIMILYGTMKIMIML